MSLIRSVPITAGALITGLIIGSVYTRSTSEPQVITNEKVVTIAGEIRTVWKDRIVEVTKTIKPDGTVIEKTTTKENNKKEEISNATAKTSHQVEPIPQLPSRYSLAVRYRPLPLATKEESRFGVTRWEATAGVRVLGPAWLEAGYTGSKDISIGLRVELQ